MAVNEPQSNYTKIIKASRLLVFPLSDLHATKEPIIKLLASFHILKLESQETAVKAAMAGALIYSPAGEQQHRQLMWKCFRLPPPHFRCTIHPAHP